MTTTQTATQHQQHHSKVGRDTDRASETSVACFWGSRGRWFKSCRPDGRSKPAVPGNYPRSAGFSYPMWRSRCRSRPRGYGDLLWTICGHREVFEGYSRGTRCTPVDTVVGSRVYAYGNWPCMGSSCCSARHTGAGRRTHAARSPLQAVADLDGGCGEVDSGPLQGQRSSVYRGVDPPPPGRLATAPAKRGDYPRWERGRSMDLWQKEAGPPGCVRSGARLWVPAKSVVAS